MTRISIHHSKHHANISLYTVVFVDYLKNTISVILKFIICKQRHYNKDVHDSGQNTSLIKHHEHEMIDTFYEVKI